MSFKICTDKPATCAKLTELTLVRKTATSFRWKRRLNWNYTFIIDQEKKYILISHFLENKINEKQDFWFVSKLSSVRN